MLTVNTKKEETSTIHKYLLGSIIPRPIAFASTIDKNGNPNLSPFSFFNAFSANPPILIFSPARRVRDNTTKHTLENVMETKEVVISIVTESMAQQVSLSSCEFKKEINEFEKAGFTAIKSEEINAYCVKESPINFECRVNDIISLGKNGGSGNLVICEIIKIHICDSILDNQNNIDPLKLMPVARLGGNWYSKITKESLFSIPKPISKIGIGIDQLPESIKKSTVFTSGDLALLAGIKEIPKKKEKNLKKEENTIQKHILSKKLLSEGKIQEAWEILL